MYVKTENGNVIAFPYDLNRFRAEHKNVSFPATIAEETLNSYGVYKVQPTEFPKDVNSKTHIVRQVNPALIDGVWTQQYSVVQRSVEEASLLIRAHRNNLLSECDWTQVADAPVEKAAWATYRQALRDITSHVNFPYILESDFPTPPA